MKFVPLVIRNLLRSRRRTILSMLSIAVSTFIFAALMSVPAVVAQLLRDSVSALRLVSLRGFRKSGKTLPGLH